MDRLIKDCDIFQLKAGELLEDWPLDQAGHDFWLTRNGHGAGFWDGDWKDSAGASLTEIAKSFGECNLYDYRRKIHVYG